MLRDVDVISPGGKVQRLSFQDMRHFSVETWQASVSQKAEIYDTRKFYMGACVGECQNDLRSFGKAGAVQWRSDQAAR